MDDMVLHPAIPTRPSTSTAEVFVTNLVIILAFFPFFQILPLGKAEVQPIGAAVALVGLAAFGLSNTGPAHAMLMFLAVCAGMGALSVLGLQTDGAVMMLQLAAYVAPIILLLFLWGRLQLISFPMMMACGWSWLAMGVLQYTDTVPGPLNMLLAGLITRYEADVLTLGRGVIMFASEPAYAAKQMILFAALALGFWRDRRLSTLGLLIVLVASIMIMVVMNRSVVGLVGIGLLLLYFVFGLLRPKWRIALAAVIVLGSVQAFTWLRNVDTSNVTMDSPRNLQVGAALGQQLARGELDFAAVARFGSARFVTSVAGFREAFSPRIIGTGIGQADTAVRRAIDNDPLISTADWNKQDFTNLKPQAFVACFVLETGFIGIAAIGFLLWHLCAAGRTDGPRAFAVTCGCTAAALFLLLLVGPHSLPAPWLYLWIAAGYTVGGRAASGPRSE